MPNKKDGTKGPKKSPASQVPVQASALASPMEETPAPFEPAGTTTPAASLQSGAVPAEAGGPLTDDLKDKFRAQSIPLQVDFHHLIDVADCGRKAVGLSPEQPGSTGDGLQLDDVKRLAVLASPGKAIEVSSNGVGVIADGGKAIEVTVNGLGVKSGPGLKINAGTLELDTSRVVRRTTLRANGNPNSAQLRTIAYSPSSQTNNYFNIHISAKTPNGAFQRFDLIASFDGFVEGRFWGSYSVEFGAQRAKNYQPRTNSTSCPTPSRYVY